MSGTALFGQTQREFKHVDMCSCYTTRLGSPQTVLFSNLDVAIDSASMVRKHGMFL